MGEDTIVLKKLNPLKGFARLAPFSYQWSWCRPGNTVTDLYQEVSYVNYCGTEK
jgi:hypothetical protein